MNLVCVCMHVSNPQGGWKPYPLEINMTGYKGLELAASRQ